MSLCAVCASVSDDPDTQGSNSSGIGLSAATCSISCVDDVDGVVCDTLGYRPTAMESSQLWGEESSLVLALVEEQGANSDGPTRVATSGADLQQCVDLCGEGLKDLWRDLRSIATPQEWFTLGSLSAVVLICEHSEDVLTLPPPFPQVCAEPPWRCHGRHRKATAVRRLM